VKIANSASLGLTSPITLEAWIKPTSLPASGTFASILTKPESYSLQFNGPKLEFTVIQNGTRKRLQAASGAIVAGQTYHVVGTYDGTTQRLYINGAQAKSGSLSGAASVTTNPLYVGSWGGTEEFFKGTIDEVAVYGSTLSAARVSAHYQAGTSTQTVSLLAPEEASSELSAYSIAAEPTFVDYCRLGAADKPHRAYEPWQIAAAGPTASGAST
ncbi:MAG: LamG domain-containing protein, partial [Solirubrobacterales bacterium]